MSAPLSATAAGREPDDVRSRKLLRPAILLLLRGQESHGYELIGRLSELGAEVSPTMSALYRCLRTMAGEGLVNCYWSTPDRGPARRVYAITEKGDRHLEESMAALAGLLRTVRSDAQPVPQRPPDVGKMAAGSWITDQPDSPGHMAVALSSREAGVRPAPPGGGTRPTRRSTDSDGKLQR